MPIDDPISAVEKHLEIEAVSSDPVLTKVAELVEALGIPWPIGPIAQKLLGRLAADRVAKVELTVEVIKDEVRRHESKIEALSNDVNRVADWVALLEDGLKKAQQTRATSRVKRIGIILANSLTMTLAPKADDVEEMMRTAMDLSDNDVKLLNELVRFQGPIVEANGRIPRFDAWQSWPQGFWGESLDADISSAFNKLESFGLVTRLAPPNNYNIQADLQNRYGLLKKGLDFIRFCKSG